MAASHFSLLALYGLRQYHYVLDVGCGSLNIGRLLIPYLLPERYFGLEPDAAAVEAGFRLDLGTGISEAKRPRISHEPRFDLHAFGVTFDYIVLQRVLSHAPDAVIAECLRSAARCLAVDGLILGAFMPGETDYQEKEWAHPGCAGYTDFGMSALAQSAGFEAQLIDWPHPEGKTWVLMYRMDRFTAPADPAHLLERPRTRFIQPEVMEALPDVGFVDTVQDVGTAVLVTGWSIDPDSGAPPPYVLFADSSGRVAATARVEIERPDVAAAHGHALRRSGFRVRITKAAIGTGLRAFGYAGNSVVSRLGGPPVQDAGQN